MDFKNKEICEVYSWTNTKFVEDACEEVRINGRIWVKTGKKQSVTFVCIKYKSIEPSNKPSNYFIAVGMAKQHPMDYRATLQDGEELAYMNAIDNPIILMDVDDIYDNIDFYKFIKKYYTDFVDCNLKMVKTKEEINFGLDVAEAINQYKEDNKYLNKLINEEVERNRIESMYGYDNK